jgi:hypothetical protein
MQAVAKELFKQDKHENDAKAGEIQDRQTVPSPT